MASLGWLLANLGSITFFNYDYCSTKKTITITATEKNQLQLQILSVNYNYTYFLSISSYLYFALTYSLLYEHTTYSVRAFSGFPCATWKYGICSAPTPLARAISQLRSLQISNISIRSWEIAFQRSVGVFFKSRMHNYLLSASFG